MAKSINKMILLNGVPACGKSTRAKEILAEDPSFRRMNYDELRLEMGIDYTRDGFSGKREHAMKQVADARVEAWLDEGLSVVIDNTNLRQSARDHWYWIAQKFGVEVIPEYIDTPLDICCQRDRKREGSARCGRPVIERMALFNGLLDWDTYVPRSQSRKKDLIICDIDGTIADLSHRLHHVKDGNHRWDLFHQEVDKDLPIQDIIDLLDMFALLQFKVIFVSGRSTEHGCSWKTEDWLEKHIRFDYSACLMRNAGDHRPDYVHKQEILDLLPKDRIYMVLDDRQQVVDMWRKNGLRCLQVAAGNF